ncbi:TraB family protein [Thiorhodovibrio winogradskyi]|uniref:TraB family protein n=1 Tax=Thiorhodovibrio winogradskyi TaxID=77007 RepID=A0ABZ0S543_9GAMM|nr:TraB/GumN family protein [Thiorhodovibrio winogradskyi]
MTLARDSRAAAGAGEEPMETLSVGDASVTLLGTAHVSRASVEKVRELLREPGAYEAVAVELCQSRYQALIDPDALAELDLFAVIRQKRAHMVAANLALSAYQQRLADQIGVEPGAEQREAIMLARRLGLPVLLIDREIGVTLRRAARNMGFFKRLNLFVGLVAGLLSRDQVTEEDIEALKQGDVLETAFSEFAENRQDLFAPLISERDQFMAARLREEISQHRYPRVLAVIGAGHSKGVARELRQQSRPADELITELQSVPPPGKLWRAFPWLVVVIIVGLFAYGFTQGPDVGWNVIGDWVLINGGLSAFGAALAGAHPLTVLGAFCAAPLTSLNPTIGAGMVAAGIELALRRPRVGDFHRLRDEIARWTGWWRNRVARILLVFLFSTIGSALGTYIAGFHLVAQLFG